MSALEAVFQYSSQRENLVDTATSWPIWFGQKVRKKFMNKGKTHGCVKQLGILWTIFNFLHILSTLWNLEAFYPCSWSQPNQWWKLLEENIIHKRKIWSIFIIYHLSERIYLVFLFLHLHYKGKMKYITNYRESLKRFFRLFFAINNWIVFIINYQIMIKIIN